MSIAAWVCLLAPLAGALLIVLCGESISRRTAGWISTLSVFLFLVLAYERLTNEALSLRQVWPGALLAAVLLQATFQILPLFVRLSREVVSVQALGTSALLLVWCYVLGNIIVFGAEVNYWWRRERKA